MTMICHQVGLQSCDECNRGGLRGHGGVVNVVICHCVDCGLSVMSCV